MTILNLILRINHEGIVLLASASLYLAVFGHNHKFFRAHCSNPQPSALDITYHIPVPSDTKLHCWRTNILSKNNYPSTTSSAHAIRIMCSLGWLTDGIQVKTKCCHQTEMLSSWILRHLTRIYLYSVARSSRQYHIGILDLGELRFSLLETAISGHKRVISILLEHLNLRYMTVPLSTQVRSHYLASRLKYCEIFCAEMDLLKTATK